MIELQVIVFVHIRGTIHKSLFKITISGLSIVPLVLSPDSAHGIDCYSIELDWESHEIGIPHDNAAQY